MKLNCPRIVLDATSITTVLRLATAVAIVPAATWPLMIRFAEQLLTISWEYFQTLHLRTPVSQAMLGDISLVDYISQWSLRETYELEWNPRESRDVGEKNSENHNLIDQDSDQKKKKGEKKDTS
jgi:hypothetical protein